MRRASYNKLIQERQKVIEELAPLAHKPFIRGSIRIQGNICGRPNCRCKRKDNPILHGPYPYLSFRGRKSNHSILLGKHKHRHAKESITNYKRLLNVLYRLSEINFRILRYHYDKLEEKLEHF